MLFSLGMYKKDSENADTSMPVTFDISRSRML